MASPPRSRTIRIRTALAGLIVLIVAYPASSGPASFALAKGWIDAGDYHFLFGPLDSALQGTPLFDSYVRFQMRWWQMGRNESQDREQYRRQSGYRVEDVSDPFGLPSIARVSVPLDRSEPRLTVVHLADWHFVPFDVFAADERMHDPEVTEDQLAELYDAFLAEVEAVQAQHRTVLEHLIKHHELKVVYVERVTDELLERYTERAKAVTAVDPALLSDSVERADRDGDSFALALAMLAQEQHTHDRLDTGAAGMLWAEGTLSELRAAEDAQTLTAANPVQADGTVHWDEVAQARREQAIADRLLETDEPLVVVVLGGRHDLSEELATTEDVRLVRVEVEAWQRAVR